MFKLRLVYFLRDFEYKLVESLIDLSIHFVKLHTHKVLIEHISTRFQSPLYILESLDHLLMLVDKTCIEVIIRSVVRRAIDNYIIFRLISLWIG